MKSLNRSTSISYGLFAVPLSWLGISIFVFLPKFYVENGYMTFAALSFAVVIFRIVDAFLDISIGRFLERRKGQGASLLDTIVWTSVPLSLTILFIFTPSFAPSHLPFTLWFILVGIVLLCCWTVVQVSYESIVPNLVRDYQERSQLLSYRAVGTLTGSFFASFFPFLLALTFSPDSVWYLVGCLIIGSFLLLARVNKKYVQYEGETSVETKPKNIFRRLRELLKEQPIRALLVAHGFTAIGAALPAALILFYVDTVLQSSRGPLFVGLYLLIATLSLPFWLRFGAKREKRDLWTLGVFLNAGSFFFVYFLSAGDELLYTFLVSLSAIGYGATLVFPTSMQADVIDYDEWRFGVRREAELSAIFLFTKKTLTALSLGAAFYLLGSESFVAETSSATIPQEMLKTLYALVPSIVSFLALVALRQYSLTAERVQTIQQEVAA